MVWHFIDVYTINRTLHGRLEIRNFSSSVEKYSRKRVKYFSTLEEKFCISARHVISSIYQQVQIDHFNTLRNSLVSIAFYGIDCVKDCDLV